MAVGFKGGHKMIVIMGCGEYGIWIRTKLLGNEENIVFYDNDRRKWGGVVAETNVITLEEFINYVNKEDTKLIVGGRNTSLLFFIKDVNPKCKVWRVEENQFVEINLNEVGEFAYDNALEIGKKNLNEHIGRMNEFKEMGKEKAYQHAAQYIEFKKEHLAVPEISSIELTNNCNLQCPNCPNATLSFHKGYMSDEVFEQAIKYLPPYKNDTISVHCMGEPLLHPKLITYLKRLAEIEVNIAMSTNGILLTEELSKEILSIFGKLEKSVLYISFHTKKSVENWHKFLQLYEKSPHNNICFRGQVLEHNEEQAHMWLKEVGINDPIGHPFIRHITSHSWAGNVAGRKKEYPDIEVNNRIRNCYYLRQRKIAVVWDGTLKGCCYDSNATQKCGNVFEFEKANIDPRGYKLCHCCDPDWITSYQ